MSHRENDMDLEVQPGMPRRKFLGMLGASMALAGVTTSGCVRRPKEFIYPENNRPENTLPGVAKQYATNALVGGGVLALSVTSMDGRPTKIEGKGAFAQAEILNLYDPDRGHECLFNGKKSSRKEVLKALADSAAKSNDGSGLAFCFESFRSPVFYSLLEQVSKKYPKALFVEQDTTYSCSRVAAVSQIVGASADLKFDFTKADVILAADSDFLGLEGDSQKYSEQFADGRRIVDEKSTMNRLYSVESAFTTTGAAADHRFALPSSKVEMFLICLAKELQKLGVLVSSDFAQSLNQNDKGMASNDRLQKWTNALAKDLAAHKGKAVVVVGDRQPAHVHALGLALNMALQSNAVEIVLNERPQFFKSMKDLQSASEKNEIKTLVICGGNPVYNQPIDIAFSKLLTQVSQTFYLGFSPDETAQKAQYYLPQTHFLESWGDVLATDGTYGIRQPLIAPLYEECINEYELFLSVLSDTRSTYEVVKSFCKARVAVAGDFETAWRSFLATGFVERKPKVFADHAKCHFSTVWNQRKPLVDDLKTDQSHLELEFVLDQTMYDGRYANNAWLQEIPNSIHKLVWDNALFVSPATAKKMNLKGNPKPGTSHVDMVKLTHKGQQLEVAVWEVPGLAEGVGVLSLGYGRSFGRVAKGSGFNANTLRTSDGWFGYVAQVEPMAKTYSLVSTQEHGSLNGTPGMKKDRPSPLREATYQDFLKNPHFVLADELIPVEEQRSHLFKYPENPTQEKWARQQWGMSIDLTTCIGCNACTVACQAENNISIVGKEEVFRNREMSWIRIDRYFSGNVDNPEVRSSFQPMNCQHCENAPCEAVCPVVATAHSPDGLNDMAYNRCVGTRYCANNCPYKVRRYNFFNYSKADDERNPLYAMQKNPNVTVRFRGVMEKCSYCVQRINAAKSEANRVTKDGLVPDGAIVTACQSACPTKSIVFGDVADPMSMVSKLKSQKRNYGVLGELNTRPRTTYLAKLRNINPEIG